MQKRARAFHHWLFLCLKGKAFFVTEGGYLGLASGSEMRVGDEICLFGGVKVPFLVREIGAGRGAWRLVAPVYVEGMMDGEVWDERGSLDEFAIV